MVEKKNLILVYIFGRDHALCLMDDLWTGKKSREQKQGTIGR